MRDRSAKGKKRVEEKKQEEEAAAEREKRREEEAAEREKSAAERKAEVERKRQEALEVEAASEPDTDEMDEDLGAEGEELAGAYAKDPALEGKWVDTETDHIHFDDSETEDEESLPEAD